MVNDKQEFPAMAAEEKVCFFFLSTFSSFVCIAFSCFLESLLLLGFVRDMGLSLQLLDLLLTHSQLTNFIKLNASGYHVHASDLK